MTIAPDYLELHHLVDRLSPDQVADARARLAELVAEHTRESDPMLADEPVRTFSFVGLMHAGPDFAERSEDLLREGFGRTPE
jgi:hypothetical protein